uniref:Transposase n=1 Tax=Heterorhabditis bacteriophora TaxID=37862 RepID=A0A1I7WWF0_HETBA
MVYYHTLPIKYNRKRQETTVHSGLVCNSGYHDAHRPLTAKQNKSS